MPFIEQESQQGNLSSSDEHERINETQNKRSLTPVNHHCFDNNHWVNSIFIEMILLINLL